MAEGRQMARYLLGVDPGESLAERYRQAAVLLFSDPPSKQDQALLSFVRRHQWSLAFLDAAMGVVQPHALLRKKILLMLAIIETHTRFAQIFEPQVSAVPLLLLRLGIHGITASFKTLIGLLIYGLFVRERR